MNGRREGLVVGLDVGTTTCKAVVYREDGTTVAAGRARTPWRTLAVAGGTGTELDANELLGSARAAIAAALAKVPNHPVVALGVTSMAESGVLLDGSGEPTAPVIAWHDTRDLDQVARLGREIGAEAFSARTGLPHRSQWSLTQHLWQLERHPGARRAVRRLNIAEWIVRGLGGEEVSDVSLASRTGWLDLKARTWWSESLDWSGASPSLLPDLAVSGTPVGRATADAGVAGLVGAVLTTAGHDHLAAAVGADAAGPGGQLDSCGTAEALVRTVPAGLADGGVARLTRGGVTVGWHVHDDHWALLGATQGGLALERLIRVLGDGADAFDRLETAARTAARDRVVVRVDDEGRPTIDAIGDGVGPGEVWLAALRAITDQVAAVGRAMTEVAGPHGRTVVTGGWSNSEVLMELKEAAFGQVERSTVQEAGTRGAAILAAAAAGIEPLASAARSTTHRREEVRAVPGTATGRS